METSVVCETNKVVCVTYSAPARYCRRRLRVFPRATRGSQHIVNLQWRCTPKPDAVRQKQDEFGNIVLELQHRYVPREFHFSMQLTTSRTSQNSDAEVDVPPVGIGAYLTPSALCDLTPEIRRLAAEPSVAGICNDVFHALEYSDGASHLGTTASQALKQGAGVCQDFAHLMIAACRTARMPARYVSGYNPAEGRMHAWVEVLQQGQWQAWDPTHNRPTRPDCVFVACGRDARDVAPISGTYQGRATASLRTWCKTTVIETAKSGEPGPVVEIPAVQVQLEA